MESGQRIGGKRKIKNSKFLSRAKKKMKEGRFNILDGETYEYFLRIAEAMKNMQSEEEEDKRFFSANVLKETKGKEWDVMCHAMSSRILENLIPMSDWSTLVGLRDATINRRSWDGFGCTARVLECMIKDAVRRVNMNLEEKSECVEFIRSTTKFFVNNLEEQLWETNANHISRSCLLACSDVDDDSLHEIVKECCLYVLGWGQLNDHFDNPLISAFLQELLTASEKSCQLTCNKLVKHVYNTALCPAAVVSETSSEELPPIFSKEPLLRLLETCLTVSKLEMRAKLYKKFFEGRLLQLSLTNEYPVIKLISSCDDKDMFEEIYSTLMNSLEDIVSSGKARILSNLSQKCVTLATKQGDFIQNMKTWLECDQKEGKLVPCLLRLKKLSQLEESSPIDHNGSVILQKMFQFRKPIKVVESLLSLDVTDLLKIAEDPKGSWIFNGFFDSSTIGDKSRYRLTTKLKGEYRRLATSKFGSRVFDRVWSTTKFKDKQSIVQELDRSLLSSPAGRCVAKKIQLELFLSDKATWSSKFCN